MSKPGDKFYLDLRGIHAEGMVTETGFVVFKGSEVRNWHDTFFRLSPYVDGWVDFDQLNAVRCDKILVEFLRMSTTISSRFPVNIDDYSVHEAGYFHLPLEKKLEVLSKITGFKEVTVCDDNTEHYNFFRDHFNPNPNDCCNLRISNRG